MPADPKFFNIFLSSPGDVTQERDDAQAVVDKINASGEFAHYFHLKLYRWDDENVVLPMPVTKTPQESVNIYMILPSQCDLTVVIFWSRMGSPLTMDNRDYLSGTHYEYSEALTSYEQKGKPDIWLYRCQQAPTIDLSDKELDDKKRQYDRVLAFFQQFQTEDGKYTGGVNAYTTHDDFASLFEGQLLTYLRHLRDNPRPIHPPQDKTAKTFTGVPYRGLKALDEDDAPIFFGRDAETLDVLSRVEQKRMVMVLGASGSGKSSLVSAGVVPKLRQHGWRIVRCVPGDDPYGNLALAMITQLPEMGIAPAHYLREAKQLAQTLVEKPANIVQQLETTLPDANILLYIDQFEEIFTLAQHNPALKDEETKRDDVAQFMQAIRHASEHVTTLATMRADFYGVALPYFDTLKQETYGLTKPSYFALLELVVRPAELAGITFDEGLPQKIVQDVGDQSGALALLAYLMESLYKRLEERDQQHISDADYEELGGVQGAINTLADKAYAQLPMQDEARLKAMQSVFRELIALTEEDGQLIPTRRRAPLDEFPPDSDARRFVDAFVFARLLVSASKTVEVAHEAILRHWEQLKDWIQRIKGDLALYRQYERDAQIWHDRGRIPADMPLTEQLVSLYKALDNIDREWTALPEPLKSYTEPEQTRLLRELETLPKDETSHERRRDIGDRLAVIGDTRKGVGVVDGVPDMLWLPVTGKFWFGEFEVPNFYISKYLVTYAQYQVFAESDYDNPKWWEGFPEQYRPQKLGGARTKIANAPRDTISWYQSVAFSRWLTAQFTGVKIPKPVVGTGFCLSEYANNDQNVEDYWTIGQDAQIRLPTEWEWQWVAMNGTENSEYPWGEWQEGYANTNEAGLSRTTSVGMYPHGASSNGVLDVSGNLWEWCANNKDNTEIIDASNTSSKVRRGGAFGYRRDDARVVFRGDHFPFSVFSYIGCRLVVAPILPRL
jgi:energy-coupling factor transporter ATP-binding protein EcfA2